MIAPAASTAADPAARSGCRWTVSGRVQGVFFRASTRERAERLGLRGSARNLPDGRVEVLAFGPCEALGKMREWLCVGPAGARVDAVLCTPLPYESHDRFVIR